DVTDGVKQIGGGYLPWTDDQEDRGQDQNHANSRGQQRSPEANRAGADAQTGSQRLSFGGLLADAREQRLGGDNQQVKPPKYGCSDDHPQCPESQRMRPGPRSQQRARTRSAPPSASPADGPTTRQ